MDPVTSRSRSNEHDSLISESRPQQLPLPYCLLQPNSQMPVFDDHISRHLQYPHQVIVAKSNPLGAPDSVSLLMNVQNPTSDLEYLDALINSPSARSSGFPDDPLMNRDDGVFRNLAPEGMENAGRGSLESVPTTTSINAPRRNRKKRKRAPRRATTAVMMTDTTNFRAMVQEFTGIPATSLVPSNLHRPGIGLLGPGISGFGSKSEPRLTYGGLLGPLVPKTKSATSGDHPVISPKIALPFDLGLLNFQPLAQVQDPAGPTQSRSQGRPDENSILGEKEVGWRTH